MCTMDHTDLEFVMKLQVFTKTSSLIVIGTRAQYRGKRDRATKNAIESYHYSVMSVKFISRLNRKCAMQ